MLVLSCCLPRPSIGPLYRWVRLSSDRAGHGYTEPALAVSLLGNHAQEPRRSFVVVSNHESFADILLISHLPWEMKWLSKAELFRIPIMGWMMWLAGDIPVKRGFGPSAVEAMERCRKALAKCFCDDLPRREPAPRPPSCFRSRMALSACGRGRSAHTAARAERDGYGAAQARWRFGRSAADCVCWSQSIPLASPWPMSPH